MFAVCTGVEILSSEVTGAEAGVNMSGAKVQMAPAGSPEAHCKVTGRLNPCCCVIVSVTKTMFGCDPLCGDALSAKLPSGTTATVVEGELEVL